MADEIEADYSTDDAARDIAALMQVAPPAGDDNGEDDGDSGPVAAAPEPVAAAPAPAASEPVAATPAAPVAAQTAPAAPTAAPPPATAKEPTASEASTQIQNTLNFAKAMTAQLQTQLMGEFEDIKSDADVYKLMGDDPGRYNRFAIAVTKIQAAQNQVGQLETQAKQASEAAQKERDGETAKARDAESAKLAALIPDLADPARGPKLVADLRKYAEDNDITSKRLGDYTAKEFVALHKAMQFDAMKAAEAANLEAATKKAAKAPPVQEPGTVQNRSNAKDEKNQANYDRFKSSGDIKDLARVLEASL